MDKILIVEDSMELSDALCRNLQEEGFAVSAASCLAQARKYLDGEVDLCLLDLNLPDGDGFAFCRYLSENTSIPVILLTVRDGAEDMVKGLSIGADDYVTKPFHMDVLVSRMRAVLRRVRGQKADGDNLYCGDVSINKRASKVYQGEKITPKAWRTEKEQLEKEMPTLRSERVRACYDLAFAEVISYNRANLERVEQNESRQQDRQQGRTRWKEEEI